MTAIVIAIALQKGGVAKTTVARHLGHYLAQMGRRALLVDLDPQMSLTHIAGASGRGGTLADVLGDVEPGTGALAPILQTVNGDGAGRLDIAPAGAALAHTEAGLVLRRAREYVLSRAIEPVAGAYDFILLDCPPALGLLLSNALIAAQWVMIPTGLDSMSLASIGLFLDTLEGMQSDYEPCARLLGTVATRANMRTILARDMLEELRRRPELRLFDTVIPATVRVEEAALLRQTIGDYDPGNPAALAFEQLTKEVIQRCQSGRASPKP